MACLLLRSRDLSVTPKPFQTSGRGDIILIMNLFILCTSMQSLSKRTRIIEPELRGARRGRRVCVVRVHVHMGAREKSKSRDNE